MRSFDEKVRDRRKACWPEVDETPDGDASMRRQLGSAL
jgi:hypothetical protein